MIRHGIRSLKQVAPSIRSMSSQANLTSLNADNDGVAVLTLQRPPVNSLNLDLLQEISKSLDEVSKNKFRALILTSASPTVFSAGLDIMEMYKPDMKRAELFWTTLQEVWLKLFESSCITAAAVNGHAPAGGCLLATSCEYRAMVSGKYTIGLNETAVGIIAPTWFMGTICNIVSTRQAEMALTTGKLFTVDEALKVGIIDDVATDKEDAINKCKEFIKKFDKIPLLARAITKQRFRASTTQWLKDNRKADVAEFIGFLSNPEIQQSLEIYIQSLKKRAK
ncbi:enoyl-CoA delta isomerase 1, mitochondrial-like [Zerene cesonia]|uniref:enoyl-CoA delta isomerase 1, mitochondrial-like n=1 Tax=Zerene cesonia TaxID=33412 RepID=UPI0018E518FE|nr:enoyl-CoA delta isomerase 1, mitochondrial-like [Zerene cesonia]